MSWLMANLLKSTASARRLLAIAAVAAILPVAAQASVIATFEWVPTSENPPSAQTATASGSLQLTLPSFALTGPTTPPNFGPYYASGTATTADITAFSYTAGNGLTVGLANVANRTLQSSIWATSGLDTPATGPQAPSPPTQGYYLISGFTLSGTTALGSPFMIANSIGTAGAMYANGIGNGTNTFNAAGSVPAIADGGYWKLASVSEVPLPGALPLLISALGGLGAIRRRSRPRR
jgi:hypothetical protein